VRTTSSATGSRRRCMLRVRNVCISWAACHPNPSRAHDKPLPRSAADHAQSYFPNAEYPRGFVGGKALKLHFFSPHFEHRILLATSSSRASQPQSLPSVCGSAVRSCPHAEHLRTNVYWPNSSLSLFTWNSRVMARIVTSQNRNVHPVLGQRRYCIENCEGRTDGTESYSSRPIPTLYEMNSRQTAAALRGRTVHASLPSPSQAVQRRDSESSPQPSAVATASLRSPASLAARPRLLSARSPRLLLILWQFDSPPWRPILVRQHRAAPAASRRLPAGGGH
jgi:hypothetical protein